MKKKILDRKFKKKCDRHKVILFDPKILKRDKDNL